MEGPRTAREPAGSTMPSIFVAHGSPLLLDDEGWVGQLRDWSRALPRPRPIPVLSAHWEQTPLSIGATVAAPLVRDFYGFPEKYYRVEYPAPGAPELAQRVRDLLPQGTPVADEPARGLDHGAYVPLVAMYPGAG